MTPKLIKIALLSGAIIYTIVWIGIAVFAYQKGYYKAIQEIKATVKADKQTLENHAKQLNKIHSESSDSANNRLRKNLRSN